MTALSPSVNATERHHLHSLFLMIDWHEYCSNPVTWHDLTYHRWRSRWKGLLAPNPRVDLGHMTSPDVTNHWWPISFDWTMPETGAWSLCALLALTHRLVHISTFSGKQATRIWYDLLSKLYIDIIQQKVHNLTHMNEEKVTKQNPCCNSSGYNVTSEELLW